MNGPGTFLVFDLLRLLVHTSTYSDAMPESHEKWVINSLDLGTQDTMDIATDPKTGIQVIIGSTDGKITSIRAQRFVERRKPQE